MNYAFDTVESTWGWAGDELRRLSEEIQPGHCIAYELLTGEPCPV